MVETQSFKRLDSINPRSKNAHHIINYTWLQHIWIAFDLKVNVDWTKDRINQLLRAASNQKPGRHD